MFRTISNITAGTTSQVQAVIDANLVPLLLHVLQYSDFKTRKEACWAVCNLMAAGTTEQVRNDFHCHRI
jgi:importin subunit alpha-6/7